MKFKIGDDAVIIDPMSARYCEPAKVVAVSETHVGLKFKDGATLDKIEKLVAHASESSLGANPDPINHPAHYTAYPVEVIELTECLNFNRGNAVKYIARAGLKSADTEVQDLEKARWYIDRELKRITK